MVSEVDIVTHYLDNHDKLHYWQKYTSIYTATALLKKHKVTAALLLASQRIMAGESVSPRIDAVMGQDSVKPSSAKNGEPGVCPNTCRQRAQGKARNEDEWKVVFRLHKACKYKQANKQHWQ